MLHYPFVERKGQFLTRIAWINVASVDGDQVSVADAAIPGAQVFFLLAARTVESEPGAYYFKFVTDGERWSQVLGDPYGVMTLEANSFNSLSITDQKRVLNAIKRFARKAAG